MLTNINPQTKVLVDLQYLANLTYYKNIVAASYVYLEQYEKHQKRSFTNRTVIAGANGKIILSVPLEKGRSQQTILKEVKISNAENWQLRHWRSILSGYNNSPWFKHLSDKLAVIYSKRFEYLVDWNLACLDWSLEVLKADVAYSLTEEWMEQVPDGIVDLRNTIRPDATASSNPIRYQQVFEDRLGFLPDLSILDLLFCEGPRGAILLLRGER